MNLAAIIVGSNTYTALSVYRFTLEGEALGYGKPPGQNSLSLWDISRNGFAVEGGNYASYDGSVYSMMGDGVIVYVQDDNPSNFQYLKEAISSGSQWQRIGIATGISDRSKFAVGIGVNSQGATQSYRLERADLP